MSSHGSPADFIPSVIAMANFFSLDIPKKGINFYINKQKQ